MTGKFDDLLIGSAHESAIWPIGMGPGSGGIRFVASSGNPGAPGLALWDARTGALEWRGSGAAGAFALALALKGSGIAMAVATEEGIVLFDIPSGGVGTGSDLGRTISVGGTSIWCVATGIFSSGADFFAGAGHDGIVYRCSTETGSPIGDPLSGHKTSVKGIGVIGRLGSNSIIVSGDEEDVVLRWDADTGQPIGNALRTGGERISAGVTPGSARYFASADYEGTVRVWDALSGSRVGRDIAAGGYPTGLALWDVNGALNVATANDADAMVRRWDVHTGQLVGDLAPGYSVAAGRVESGIVVLAIGGIDGSIRLMYQN